MKQVRWSSQEQTDLIHRMQRDLLFAQLSILINSITLILIGIIVLYG